MSTVSRASLRCAWLSISRHCLNRGNLIIEHALNGAIRIPGVVKEYSAFRLLSDDEIREINVSDVVVLPGATILDVNEHPAMESLRRTSTGVLAPGVAFCTQSGTVDVGVLDAIRQPLGSRDPFTHEVVGAAGHQSWFVGCPTLLLGAASSWRTADGPIVLSPGLGPQEQILQCLLACGELGPCLLLEHVPNVRSFRLTGSEIRQESIETAEQAIEIYATAALVITGRLHALLPCLAFGTPVLFMGGWRDSRYSLIDYLGIPVEPLDPGSIRAKAASILTGGTRLPIHSLERAHTLRTALIRYLKEIGGGLGLEVLV